jgi:tetratricopeptide (TPR) repeat protein
MIATVTTVPLADAAGTPDLDSVYQSIVQLDAARRHDEALAQAKRLEQLARARFGTNNSSYAYALGVEAWMLEDAGKTSDAEALYIRAVNLFGMTEGVRSDHVGAFLGRLAKMYMHLGRFPEGEKAFRMALAIYESRGKAGDGLAADTLLDLSSLLDEAGRPSEAEPVVLRAQSLYTDVYGPDSPQVADALTGLALIREAEARYSEAEDVYVQLGKLLEKIVAPTDPRLTKELNNVASLYVDEGRFAEAETVLRRVMTLTEGSQDRENQTLGHEVIGNLALVLGSEGRLEEAAQLDEKVLKDDTEALGPTHPKVLLEMHNLAATYADLGRLDEAVDLFRRVLAANEKLFGADGPELGKTLDGLANALDRQGKDDEAVKLMNRALAIDQKAFGQDHPIVAGHLYNLGNLERHAGHPDPAEADYQRALFIQKAALPPDSPDLADSYNNLGTLYASLGRWEEALVNAREASNVVMLRARKGEATLQSAIAAQPRRLFSNVVIAASHVAEASPGQANDLSGEAFIAAQRADQSAAAAALRQMTLRFSAGGGALASAIRNQQDLATEAKKLDRALIAALAKPAAQRNEDAEKALRQQAKTVDDAIAALNDEIKKSFPDYAALAAPEPLSIEAAQQLLRPGEALLVYLVTPTDTFVWAISHETALWHSIPVGADDLAKRIAALRQRLGVGNARGLSRADADAAPIELKGLYALYSDILQPVEAALKGNSDLLVVPSGSLTSIPFHLLISAPPPGGDFTKADWLLRSYAVTTVPAVSSLKALRAGGRGEKAPKLLIGFGDPVFGQGETDAGSRQVAAVGRGFEDIETHLRITQADRDRLAAALPALPGTATELKAVARTRGQR